MSVHFRGVCHRVDNVVCKVPCNTKWSKTQPNLRLEGFATEVVIENGTATIQ